MFTCKNHKTPVTYNVLGLLLGLVGTAAGGGSDGLATIPFTLLRKAKVKVALLELPVLI